MEGSAGRCLVAAEEGRLSSWSERDEEEARGSRGTRVSDTQCAGVSALQNYSPSLFRTAIYCIAGMAGQKGVAVLVCNPEVGGGRMRSSGISICMVGLGLALIWGHLERVGATDQKASLLRGLPSGLSGTDSGDLCREMAGGTKHLQ